MRFLPLRERTGEEGRDWVIKVWRPTRLRGRRRGTPRVYLSERIHISEEKGKEPGDPNQNQAVSDTQRREKGSRLSYYC